MIYVDDYIDIFNTILNFSKKYHLKIFFKPKKINVLKRFDHFFKKISSCDNLKIINHIDNNYICSSNIVIILSVFHQVLY